MRCKKTRRIGETCLATNYLVPLLGKLRQIINGSTEIKRLNSPQARLHNNDRTRAEWRYIHCTESSGSRYTPGTLNANAKPKGKHKKAKPHYSPSGNHGKRCT